jgi:phospho-N-acetylmuramoyl-pentapeptide-transferase
MIYWLVNGWLEALEDRGFGFLRVFTYATFRSIAAIVLSFFICIILGPRVIAWLRKQKMTDLPGFDQAEIDALMASKKGTPTMGGILIVFAIAITVLLLGRLDERAFHVKMALVCLIWLAAVGAADDWLKLTAGRRAGSRQGLYSWEKFLFQLGLSVILMWFTYRHGRHIPESHTLYFPFFKELYFELGAFAFILLGTLVLTGTSNAVNLTDGLDGLASGCMAIVSFTFFVLALIVGTPTLIGNRTLAEYLLLPHIQMGDEMAVIAGAMIGASLGFLWFNCNPAKVFMGDTGSLALGGLIGYVAIVIRQELVLLIVGGIFVAEALSVLMQVSYFKYTRKRYGEGRRIFLMAPLHYHFQRKGWTETQVVVRFWLITAMLAAMALATVKLR